MISASARWSRSPRGFVYARSRDGRRRRAYAIDYAYAAIEEAEYAVLQAELARMDADALEASAAA